MDKPERPQLGAWFKFERKAVRQVEGDRRNWVSMPISDYDGRRMNPRIASYEGMYVGWRTYMSGIYHGGGGVFDSYNQESDWVDAYLEGVTPVEVWLFVVNDRRNPIAVLPGDAILIRKAIPFPKPVIKRVIEVGQSSLAAKYLDNVNRLFGTDIDLDCRAAAWAFSYDIPRMKELFQELYNFGVFKKFNSIYETPCDDPWECEYGCEPGDSHYEQKSGWFEGADNYWATLKGPLEFVVVDKLKEG